MRFALLLILLASPSFAVIPSARDAKDLTDKTNGDKFKNEKHRLLVEVDKAINEAIQHGDYFALVGLGHYSDETIRRVSDALTGEGYIVSDSFGRHGGRVLSVEWR